MIFNIHVWQIFEVHFISIQSIYKVRLANNQSRSLNNWSKRPLKGALSPREETANAEITEINTRQNPADLRPLVQCLPPTAEPPDGKRKSRTLNRTPSQHTPLSIALRVEAAPMPVLVSRGISITGAVSTRSRRPLPEERDVCDINMWSIQTGI